MTRETDPGTSFIGDFSVTVDVIDLPESTINVSEVDDQIRDAKQMTYNTLKSCTGEVTATHTELNYIDGLGQPVATITRGQTGVGVKTATESGGDYTLATSASLTLAEGMRFTFLAGGSCGATPTLTVDSNAAKTIKMYDGTALASSDIPSGGIVDVIYDGTDFRVLSGLLKPSTDYNTTASYTSNDTFTVPAGVYKIRVRAIGGGGGGAVSTGSGGGGGGGGYAEDVIDVIPAGTVNVYVGSGGAGGNAGSPPSPDNGSSGGTSRVLSGGTYYATAGSGGGGAGTVGGSAGTGDTSGGAGGTGSTGGGGGGSGAGTDGSGVAGSNGAGNDGGAGGTGSDGDAGGAGGTSGTPDGGNGTAWTSTAATDYTANSGGGGGGGYYAGSGITHSSDGGDGALAGSGGGGGSYYTLGNTVGGDGAGGLVVIAYNT